MRLDQFDFVLPEHLIAQAPAPERDASRLMVVQRATGKREHHVFRDLPDILDQNYFLVINNTRVFPARVRASRPGKQEEIEVLLVKESGPNQWVALLKPSRKAPPGQKLVIGDLTAVVVDITESGSRVLQFDSGADVRNALETIGEPPIPPYIHREKDQDLTSDRDRYQTVFARHSGSIAAPTAGLHFTENVLRRLEERRIAICEILLHVGYGTFKPIRSEDIRQHRMEPEHYEISKEAAARIRSYKNEGRRLLAVGTTTTRCLEYVARQDGGIESSSAGACDLFIYPGFEFRMIDALLTNFHLPKSTLLMLASAFAGRELLLDCYREAVSENYRFYSYGDCMLII